MLAELGKSNASVPELRAPALRSGFFLYRVFFQPKYSASRALFLIPLCARTFLSPQELTAKQLQRGAIPMRLVVAFLFVLSILGFGTAASADDPRDAKTKVDCQRAGGMWDVKTNSCLRRMACDR
jgi:hypothetical protein